jgi:hypothetical protein
MNLGKFMTFANAAGIVHSRDKPYSEGKLPKDHLLSVFKKAAEGEREVGLPVFMGIMEELRKSDEGLFAKLGLGEEGTKGHSKLLNRLKYLNLPFNTRDPHGREPSPYGRVFVPKLTAHSGKSEEALREELSSRRMRGPLREEALRSDSKLSASQKGRGRGDRSENKARFTFKLGQPNDDLERSDLSFLSKLITQE